MDAATRERVKRLLREFTASWIAKQYEELRRIEEEGFSPSGVLAPFHDALVPGIRGLGSEDSRPPSATCMNGSHCLSLTTIILRRAARLIWPARYRCSRESS